MAVAHTHCTHAPSRSPSNLTPSPPSLPPPLPPQAIARMFLVFGSCALVIDSCVTIWCAMGNPLTLLPHLHPPTPTRVVARGVYTPPPPSHASSINDAQLYESPSPSSLYSNAASRTRGRSLARFIRPNSIVQLSRSFRGGGGVDGYVNTVPAINSGSRRVSLAVRGLPLASSVRLGGAGASDENELLPPRASDDGGGD